MSGFSWTAFAWALGIAAYIGTMQVLAEAIVSWKGWRRVAGILLFAVSSSVLFGFIVGSAS